MHYTAWGRSCVMRTHLFFCSFQLGLCLGIRGAKDHQGVWNLEAMWILWHRFRSLKCEPFPFCFGSDALAFGRPAADSSRAVVVLEAGWTRWEHQTDDECLPSASAAGQMRAQCLTGCPGVWGRPPLCLCTASLTTFGRVVRGWKYRKCYVLRILSVIVMLSWVTGITISQLPAPQE